VICRNQTGTYCQDRYVATLASFVPWPHGASAKSIEQPWFQGPTAQWIIALDTCFAAANIGKVNTKLTRKAFFSCQRTDDSRGAGE